MKVEFTRRHIIVLALLVVVVIGLVFALRYFYIVPTIQEIEYYETNLETEKQLLRTLQERVQDDGAIHELTSLELQKRVPVSPLLDQLLLDLSRAEILSNSYILNITFDDMEVESLSDLISVESEEGTEQSDEETTENSDNEDGQSEEADFHFNGLRKIVADMQLSALNYNELAKFLEAIDNMPRLINIESVQFVDDTGELVTVDDEVYELYFDVKLSTFYYPNLEELKDEVPTVDYPNPANKENPLYDN